MGWAEAKAQIVTVLGAVSITSPSAMGIKKVYPNPPDSINDLPCFILYPPVKEPTRGSALRVMTYTVRMRLLVSDADLDVAAAIVDSFGDAVIDAFDAAFTLAHTAEMIGGPKIEEAASFTYGGKPYTGVDCMLTVTLSKAATYSG